MKKKTTKVIFGIASLFFLGSGAFSIQKSSLKGTVEVAEMASRTTELGKISKNKNIKEEKEIDILMADPAMKQKWDNKMIENDKALKRHKILGSKKIVVAIIDTGIDVKHTDLDDNLWINEKEKNGKPGVDDDLNGYVDDIHGWNFVANDHNLKDNHGHGTHVSGIIGAENNGKGIRGVAPEVSLMVLKYYDPNALSKNNLLNTVNAIKYATAMGADIINYSGGGLQKSALEEEAVKAAQKKGILVVAAAGNESSNSDISGYYPADYDADNIISVTAVDRLQKILPSSNFGSKSVDVAAPGNKIYSTLPGGGYGFMTGTSQATPFVTGLAVLLKAKYQDFGYKQIIKHINETGDFSKSLIGKTKHQKRINSYRALSMLDNNVSATGVIAVNTEQINPELYTSDPTKHAQALHSATELESSSSLMNLGRQLKGTTTKNLINNQGSRL